ncbi:MAG: hypothetical protein ABUT20_29990, partial [Bacteroidota bacterium]
MRKLRLIILLAAIVTTSIVINSCFTKSSGDKLPDTISYNFHIRPILSDKCFKCHGPDVSKRQGQFRLDIADSAFAPLKE